MNIRSAALLFLGTLAGFSLGSPRHALAREAAGPLPATIRSLTLNETADGYGWTLTQKPMPALRDHQVLIHVRAIALNHDDLPPRRRIPNVNLTGFTIGSDAAGDVVAVGKSVTAFHVGERVTNTYFRNWAQGIPARAQINRAKVPGVASDYTALDDTAVVEMPKGYSYEEAATLPTAGVTAWVATVGRTPLSRDKVVLIEGTGGVSTFAMQFAAASGAQIILTSSSDDKLKRTLQIAPHQSINYQSLPMWGKSVLEMTGGRGVDLVVDVGGKNTLPEAARSLAPGGTLSIVGGLTGYDGEISASALLGNVAMARGVYVGSREDFRKMNEFIESHRLHPVIEQVFPLEQYEQALSLLNSDRFIGKIVLRFDNTSDK